MKSIPIRKIGASQHGTPDAGGFSIRDLAALLGGNDLHHEFHRHDYFFILALKKGEGKHEIDFVEHEVRDHSIFLLRPGQVHQLELKAGCTGFLLQFNQGFYYPTDKTALQLLRRSTARNFCQLDPQKSAKLFSILEFIYQEYTDKQEAYQESIKAYLGILFIELLRHRQQNQQSPGNQMLYAQERMDELTGLLESSISKYKQVADYARLMNLSAYQLNAITKQMLGKTCSEFINEYVVLESKRLLLATSNQITQIADSLGYEDISYFIRFFKKHTGHSPDAFRKQFGREVQGV